MDTLVDTLVERRPLLPLHCMVKQFVIHHARPLRTHTLIAHNEWTAARQEHTFFSASWGRCEIAFALLMKKHINHFRSFSHNGYSSKRHE